MFEQDFEAVYQLCNQLDAPPLLEPPIEHCKHDQFCFICEEAAKNPFFVAFVLVASLVPALLTFWMGEHVVLLRISQRFLHMYDGGERVQYKLELAPDVFLHDHRVKLDQEFIQRQQKQQKLKPLPSSQDAVSEGRSNIEMQQV